MTEQRIHAGRQDHMEREHLRAGERIVDKLAPMLRAVGISAASKTEIEPQLVRLEGIIYAADSRLERHQKDAVGQGFDFTWIDSLRQICADQRWPMETLEPLLQRVERFCRLETKAVRRPLDTSRTELSELVDLRCVDLDLLSFAACQFVGARWGAELRAMFHQIYVLKDIEDDLVTTVGDRARGSFNCYNIAELNWGTDLARRILDDELKKRNIMLVRMLHSAGDACVADFAVFAGEAASDTEAAAIRLSTNKGADLRQELIMRLERGSAAAFSYYWKVLDDAVEGSFENNS